MLNPFKKYLDNIKAMVQNEVELIKLKAYKNLSSVVANVYMVISLLIFLILTLGISTIWLGFFFSELMESFSAGFGVTAALYFIILAILVIFRQAILVRPIENLMAKAYKDPPAKKEAAEPVNPQPAANPVAAEKKLLKSNKLKRE